MADPKTTTVAPDSEKGKQTPELSDAQFDHFMLHGEMPEKGEPDPKAGDKADDAEAAAAEAVDSAASTDAKSKTGPEPVDPTKKPTKQGQKKTAGERATEIEREAEAEEQRLQAALERRRRAKDAADALDREEPPPAKRAGKDAEAAAAAKDAVPVAKKYGEMPGAPKAPSIDDPKFKDVGEFMAALQDYTVEMGHFIAEKVAEERAGGVYDQRFKEQQEVSTRDQEFSARMADSMDRMSKELEADPEIIDRIPKKWRDLNPSDRRKADEPMTPAHFVKDQVMFNSTHSLKVSEALCKDNFAELNRIARMRPEQIIREIAILDHSFGPMAASADTSDEEPAAEAVAHPRVSKAAAPAKALGKKAAPGVDPLKKAIAENDFETFNALESARERSHG